MHGPLAIRVSWRAPSAPARDLAPRGRWHITTAARRRHSRDEARVRTRECKRSWPAILRICDTDGERRPMMPQTVIHAPGVLAYEPFGFTNCVRWGDTLYLSGISALDTKGSVVGADDIGAQTVKTYENIGAVLAAA